MTDYVLIRLLDRDVTCRTTLPVTMGHGDRAFTVRYAEDGLVIEVVNNGQLRWAPGLPSTRVLHGATRRFCFEYLDGVEFCRASVEVIGGQP